MIPYLLYREYVNMNLDSYNSLNYVNFEIMSHFQEGEDLQNILTCLKETAKDGNNVINLYDHSYKFILFA